MKQQAPGRKTKQREQLRYAIGIATAVLIVLIGLLLFVKIVAKDDLAGTWGAEDLLLEFNGKGKGVRIHADEIERFDYEIKGDRLFVDFWHETVPDLEYTFSVKGGNLLLTDADGTTLMLEWKK